VQRQGAALLGRFRPLAVTRKIGPDGTEWTVAAIPFGGYVKMLDEREAPVDAKEVHRAFNRQSVGRRFVIVVAGPLFNFLFAIAVYAGLYMHGLPEPAGARAAPPAGTPAHAAGFAAGDTVRSIEESRSRPGRTCAGACCRAHCRARRCASRLSGARGGIAMHLLDLRASLGGVESDALEKIGLRLYRPPLDL
jgi:regulator of sigma E protease